MMKIACFVALLANCGGTDSPAGSGGAGGNNGPGGNVAGSGGNSGGSGPMSARVDGQPWAATLQSVSALPVPGIPGSFVILGTQPAMGTSKGITLTTYNIKGLGTYPIGTDDSVFGVRAQYSDSGQVWASPDTGAAGTLMLTTLTPTRIAGTFTFTATPGHRNTTMTTHEITQGQFDMPLTTNGSLPTVPDGKGSHVAAMIGNDHYNAASVVNALYNPAPGGGLNISSHNDVRKLEILVDTAAGLGTFVLDGQQPGITHIAVGDGAVGGLSGGNCCWGTGSTAASTGNVVITSVTATRVKGTFAGMLQPQEHTAAASRGSITVTGDFDVGLQ